VATVRELLDVGVARLREAGSESARLDAEVLLAYALDTDRTGILANPDAPVGDGSAARFATALDRRAAGEPVAYIRGFKEFHGLAISVDRRALIPRPETEALVDAGIAAVMSRLGGRPSAGSGQAGGREPRPVRIADVGTGSGAIVVAVAAALRARRVEPGRDVTLSATDISADALQLARENAVGHGLAEGMEFLEADLLPPIPAGRRFDVVLANLPY